MEVDVDAFALPGDDSFENDRAGQVIQPARQPDLSKRKTLGDKRSAEEIMFGSDESSDSDSDEEEDEETPLVQKRARI